MIIKIGDRSYSLSRLKNRDKRERRSIKKEKDGLIDKSFARKI